MIAFRGVSKTYHDVEALRDVSFEVHAGEIVGYIGPNGAGKTTTLRILTGLVSRYHGAVTVDGQDVESRRSELHKIVGYLPQDVGFQEWRSAARALLTLGRLSGLQGDRLKRRVAAVMEMLGITEYAARRISNLSGGTRQKLLFAQAILHDPKIVILDEPLTGLDPTGRYKLKEIVRTAASAGCAVLLSSHVLADVEDLADRIAIINHGSLVGLGTPAELRTRYGSDTTIELVVRTPDALREVSIETLGGMPRVEQRNETTARIIFSTAEDASAAMKELLGRLARSDGDVRTVRRVEPSLEEIYIALTETRR